MNVSAVYHGESQVTRIYHGGNILFQIDPVEFHVIEDGKLIILGALSATPFLDGLYLDCSPDTQWEYPVQKGNVLSIKKVYNATPRGNVLEVE